MSYQSDLQRQEKDLEDERKEERKIVDETRALLTRHQNDVKRLQDDFDHKTRENDSRMERVKGRIMMFTKDIEGTKEKIQRENDDKK
jgi:peptidoglycan hydrolase CwlO-like protein